MTNQTKVMLRLLIASLMILLLAPAASAQDQAGTTIKLWPLLYHNEDKTQVLWPIFDKNAEGHAVRPIYSIRDNGDTFNFIWPLFHWNREGHWRFLLLWWGPGYFQLFPLLGVDTEQSELSIPDIGSLRHRVRLLPAIYSQSLKGDRFTLLPIFSWNKDDYFYLFPYLRTREGKFAMLFPLIYYIKGEFFTIFPLYWQFPDRRQAFLFPIIWYRHHDYFNIIPIYSYRVEGQSKVVDMPFPFFGLVSARWGRDDGARILPFISFYKYGTGTRYFQLGGLLHSLRKVDERGGVTHWNILFPFLWFKSSPEESTQTLFPLLGHYRGYGANIYALLPLTVFGHTGSTQFVNLLGPIFTRRHDVKQQIVKYNFLWPFIGSRTDLHSYSRWFFPVFHQWGNRKLNESWGWYLLGLVGHSNQPDRRNWRICPFIGAGREGDNRYQWALLSLIKHEESPTHSLLRIAPLFRNYRDKANNGFSFWALFPFYWHAQESPGENQWNHWRVIFPIYWSHQLSAKYPSYSDSEGERIIAPIYWSTYKDETGQPSRRFLGIFPIYFSKTVGDGHSFSILGPIYWHYRDKVERAWALVWPVYWVRHDDAGNYYHRIFYRLFRVERAGDEKTVEVWPLFRRTAVGKDRLQFNLLWPVFEYKTDRSLEDFSVRILWRLLRRQNIEGERTLELGPVFRHTRDEVEHRTERAYIFGLINYENASGRKSLRLFYLPRMAWGQMEAAQ